MDKQNQIDLSGSNFDIAKWVWQNLVPKSGQSDSLQGELSRAVEKLRWETQNNGNINWDDRFEMFITFLSDTFQNESGFSKERKESIAADLHRLLYFIPVDQFTKDSDRDQLPYSGDDLYNRLVDHVAEYCRLHPEIIPRDKDPNQYR